jgi:SAM-dependent MidA family methyltransferase
MLQSDFKTNPFDPGIHHNIELVEFLRSEISQAPNQRITFAQYMDRVLYHPSLGYYSNRALKMGQSGDFFTSAHLGHDFAELLAVQFAQMWEILGKPVTFTLVEMGAGQGWLAADILRYLQTHHPSLFDALTYLIIEKAPALIALQQKHLASWAGRVKWQTLAEIAPDSITGCCFSNELVDAFPVHQVVRDRENLKEVHLQLSSDPATPFQECLDDFSTPALEAYFEHAHIDLTAPSYPLGYRTEVNLQALDWLSSVANLLKQGYLLTIDYGYHRTEQYFSPARQLGTLQCYFQHTTNANPFANIGNQDITAHVDFGTLIRKGLEFGLQTLDITQQAMFLMSLGLGERLALNSTAPSGDVSTTIKRRDALHQLISPHGLGGFQVLLQGKGLTEAEQSSSLRGFASGDLPRLGLPGAI